MHAIILAGGKGSRFAPVTDTIPKALLPVSGVPLLEQTLSQLPETIDHIVIVTYFLGHKIREHFGSNFRSIPITYTEQSPDWLGTWAAFASAFPYVDHAELFLVMGCDDFFDKNSFADFCALSAPAFGVSSRVMPAKYHAVMSSNGIVTGFARHPNENREEPVEGLFANGVYLLDRRVFDFSPRMLIDGEYGLPQTLVAMAESYPLVMKTIANWQPINSPTDLAKFEKSNQ